MALSRTRTMTALALPLLAVAACSASSSDGAPGGAGAAPGTNTDGGTALGAPSGASSGGAGGTSGGGGSSGGGSGNAGSSSGGGSNGTTGGAPIAIAGNPFAGADTYVNSDWVAEIETSAAASPADAAPLRKVEADVTAARHDPMCNSADSAQGAPPGRPVVRELLRRTVEERGPRAVARSIRWALANYSPHGADVRRAQGSRVAQTTGARNW